MRITTCRCGEALLCRFNLSHRSRLMLSQPSRAFGLSVSLFTRSEARAISSPQDLSTRLQYLRSQNRPYGTSSDRPFQSRPRGSGSEEACFRTRRGGLNDGESSRATYRSDNGRHFPNNNRPGHRHQHLSGSNIVRNTRSSNSAQRSKDARGSHDRVHWQTQKSALKQKFENAAWNPRKKLSPDALEGIRELHRQYPETYTTPVLAQQFEVSPEAIRRILKSNWRPNDEEEADRRKRWDKRGETIWSRWVEMGLKPPKKWREMGVGKAEDISMKNGEKKAGYTSPSRSLDHGDSDRPGATNAHVPLSEKLL